MVKNKKYRESDCRESDYTQDDSQTIKLVHELPFTTTIIKAS
jgi:hypothetical protein